MGMKRPILEVGNKNRNNTQNAHTLPDLVPRITMQDKQSSFTLANPYLAVLKAGSKVLYFR